MKPFCALLLLLLLVGCATEPEDREFFDRGWVHPGVDNENGEMRRNFFWDDNHPQ